MTDQPELLNEFIGRQEPSEKLINRATDLQHTFDDFDLSPAVVRMRLSYDKFDDALEATDSPTKEALMRIRMAGRVATTVALSMPLIASFMINSSRFDKQLRKEYPRAFTKPNPNPDFSTKPVLKSSREHYVSEILELTA